MKKIARKLEELFFDITFAEDREFSSAREALSRIARKMEDTFTAVSFAEAGEFETAAGYLNKGGESPKQQRPCCRTKTFTRLCAGKA